MPAYTMFREFLLTRDPAVKLLSEACEDEVFDGKCRGGFHSDNRCVAGIITRPSQADQGNQSLRIRKVYQTEDLRRQCIDRPFQGLRRMSPWL